MHVCMYVCMYVCFFFFLEKQTQRQEKGDEILTEKVGQIILCTTYFKKKN